MLTELRASTCLFAAMGVVAPALAQSAGLDDIVVTAQRREQGLQSVPLSVSVLDSAAIETRQIFDIRGLQASVPNIVLEPPPGAPGSVSLFIRGLGQDAANFATDPGVALYINDVYIARQTGALVDLYDIERIEVLRGPQGTLYGRNSTGGAVKVVNREPDLETMVARGEVVGGSYGTLDLRGVVGTPLAGGKAAIRAMAVYRERSDNLFTNLTPTGVQDRRSALTSLVQLKAVPRDDVELLLAWDINHQRSIPQGASAAGPTLFGDNTDGDLRTYESARNAKEDFDQGGISARVRWNLSDAFSLTSITAFRYSNMLLVNDADGVEASVLETYQDLGQTQFTQEFLLGYVKGRVDAVAGFFYIDETNEFFDAPPETARRSYQDTGSVALFAQGGVEVIDGLRVMGGVRYTSESKTLQAGGPGFPITGDKASFDQVTWRAGVDWRVSDQVFLYASAATGFKAGGFNPFGEGTIEPETVTTYEGGFKTDFFENRLRLNGTYFRSSFKNQASILFTAFVIPGSVFTYYNNDAKYQGVEIEASARPLPGLQLDGSFGWLDSELTRPDPDLPPTLSPFPPFLTVEAGNRMRQTPEFQWSFAGSYTHRLSERVNAILAVSYRHSGTWFSNETNERPFGGFDLVDMSLALESASQRWRITAGVTNLTNQQYEFAGFRIPLLVDSVYLNEPRIIRVTVGYSF
ncbi:TonB-dependent receptor [Thermaurantiacus sp.]